jgi:transcriptional regulator with XRE-family HTH domain
VAKRKRITRRPKVAFPLRAILAHYKLSQNKLAKACGMNPTYLSRLCMGKVVPGWKTILRIATAVGADLGDFRPGALPEPNGRADEPLLADLLDLP